MRWPRNAYWKLSALAPTSPTQASLLQYASSALFAPANGLRSARGEKMPPTARSVTHVLLLMRSGVCAQRAVQES